jgi:hypothetical protein
VAYPATDRIHQWLTFEQRAQELTVRVQRCIWARLSSNTVQIGDLDHPV